MVDVKSIRKVVLKSLGRIRTHPFILAANSQQLSQEQVCKWIMCAGRESKTFPSILEKMVLKCHCVEIREILRRNLSDEQGNGHPEESHFNHYLKLLEELNISKKKFGSYQEKAGICFALNLAHRIAQSPQKARALGYLLINEAITPITYRAVEAALVPFYPTLRTQFFQLHISSDRKHVLSLYKAMGNLLRSERQEVLFGISIGERAMSCLLDEAYGVFG